MTFPLTGPSGSRRPDDGESRILRQRLAALEDARDRAAAGGPAFKSARQLVKVIDQGHIPTTPDKFFACNPCDADGAESEGTVPSFDCDQDTTLYVDFLGQAPAANDMAVASAVGGRWVAEAGRSEKKCGCLACNDQIPATDLTLTIAPPIFTGNPPVFPGTSGTTLLFNGSSSNPRWERCIGVLPPNPDGPWTTPDGVHFNIAFRLSCGPLFGSSFSAAPGCFGPDVTLFHLVSSSADPFELVFLEKNGGFVNGNFFDVTYTITGPPSLGNAPKYCVTICVFSCTAIPGATVTITDGSGNTVASGVTGPSGCVLLDIGKKGTYTVTISAPGYPTKTVTQPLTCTRYGFSVKPPNTICCPINVQPGAFPIPTSLHLTTSLGTVPFVLTNLGLNSSTVWLAQQTYTPDGDMVTDMCSFDGRNEWGTLGPGSVQVIYFGTCVVAANGTPQLQVQARWQTTAYNSPPFTDIQCTPPGGIGVGPRADWYALTGGADSVCVYVDTGDPTKPFAGAFFPFNATATLAKAPTSVLPFAWSGSLVVDSPAGAGCIIPPVLDVAVSA